MTTEYELKNISIENWDEVNFEPSELAREAMSSYKEADDLSWIELDINDYVDGDSEDVYVNESRFTKDMDEVRKAPEKVIDMMSSFVENIFKGEFYQKMEFYKNAVEKAGANCRFPIDEWRKGYANIIKDNDYIFMNVKLTDAFTNEEKIEFYQDALIVQLSKKVNSESDLIFKRGVNEREVFDRWKELDFSHLDINITSPSVLDNLYYQAKKPYTLRYTVYVNAIFEDPYLEGKALDYYKLAKAENKNTGTDIKIMEEAFIKLMTAMSVNKERREAFPPFKEELSQAKKLDSDESMRLHLNLTMSYLAEMKEFFPTVMDSLLETVLKNMISESLGSNNKNNWKNSPYYSYAIMNFDNMVNNQNVEVVVGKSKTLKF